MKHFTNCLCDVNRFQEESLLKNERGFSLIETLIAVALIGIICVVIASGLNTSSKVILLTDELETAKNLAQSLMEDVKKQNYLTSYSAIIPNEYKNEGFSAQIFTNSDLRDGIQKIRVVVSHENKEITLEGYKVRR
jgi:prepilin-type N-terminal cleavage/methylation domain-containing protein